MQVLQYRIFPCINRAYVFSMKNHLKSDTCIQAKPIYLYMPMLNKVDEKLSKQNLSAFFFICIYLLDIFSRSMIALFLFFNNQIFFLNQSFKEKTWKCSVWMSSWNASVIKGSNNNKTLLTILQYIIEPWL